MHFWIDKRSQGCGRYRVPLSFTGPSRNQRFLCVGVHPKLMVTPVHRFQSIESVVTNTTRHPRGGPSYHTRLPVNNVNINNNNCGPSSYSSNNASTSNRNANVTNPMEILDNRQQHHQQQQQHHQHQQQQQQNLVNSNSATPRRNSATSKLKCVVWAFFGLATFFITGAKYYFHPGIMGMEAYVLCTVLGTILFIGAVISLYDAVIKPDTNNNNNNNDRTPQQPLSAQISNETHEPNDIQQQQQQQQARNDNNRTIAANRIDEVISNEMPPPPYHIAIMLPSSQVNINREPRVTIVGDSPPPSYEKVVT